MAEQGMRSYEMTEIVAPRPGRLPDRGVRDRDRRLRRGVPVGRHRRGRPGHAPGTGTPEPGGLTARQLLDAVRRFALELPVVGVDVVEVSPPYDRADVTAFLANRVVLEVLSGIAFRRAGKTWADIPSTLLEARISEPGAGAEGEFAMTMTTSGRRVPTSRRSELLPHQRHPVFFVGATPFNLLGLDRWVRNFDYITYYDAWDGAHPRVFTPKDKPYIEFESGEEINNYLLQHPEVQAYMQRGGGRPQGGHGLLRRGDREDLHANWVTT